MSILTLATMILVIGCIGGGFTFMLIKALRQPPQNPDED